MMLKDTVARLFKQDILLNSNNNIGVERKTNTSLITLNEKVHLNNYNELLVNYQIASRRHVYSRGVSRSVTT